MRIAIVNDLALATETLRRLLMDIPGVQVAWTAVNGAQAVDKARSDRPDLILMDMVMPIMDGAEATQHIMRECPCSIVVVTASIGANAGRVYEALSAGALDATETPSIGAGWDAAREQLRRKIDQIRRLRGADGRSTCAPPGTFAPGANTPTTPASAAPAASAAIAPPTTPANAAPPVAALPTAAGRASAWVPPSASRDPVKGAPGAISGLDGLIGLIGLIGSSTGGPQALAEVLASLPLSYPFALVAVQHLDVSFVPGLVGWLARETGRPVEIAVRGAPARQGVLSIAPGPEHLTITPGGRFAESSEPRDSIHRPSVDVLFRSALENRITPFAAALLTGMGRDGAEGLQQLRRAGWQTIAQDQGTSVVWGMPGSAVRLDAASAIVPIKAVGGEFMRIVASRRRVS